LHRSRAAGVLTTALAFCGVLAGCANPATVCTAQASHEMLVAELFFGRTIAPAYQRELGATVTDAQWADFTRSVLTPAFPDGLTALDAQGQWRDPATGVMSREPATLVIVAAPDTDQTRRGLDKIMAQYRAQFHQQSVGLILRQDCTNF
jgi:Protein of unknown function (DUF3574)